MLGTRILHADTQTGQLESFKDNEGNVIEIGGPYGMASDPDGNLYISEVNKKRILKISPEGNVSVFLENM